ncbi:MAG: serpin family protein [Bacteroidota bacterium]|nr:serpin family protein [Bacteroidota bacterium]
MNRIPILTICILLLSMLHIECRDTGTNVPQPPPQQTRRQLTTHEQQLVGSTNVFGLKLFGKINELDNKPNIFISPLSVSYALGMTLNGASGATYDSMQKTLELNGLTNQEINESYKGLTNLLTNLDTKVIFTIANSIWHRNDFPVEEEFIQTNRTYFDAEVASLDFSNPTSADIINAWVSKKTREKIKEVIQPPIPWSTVMYLINAIYFKGTWTFQFDTTKTRDGEFTCSDGSKKTVRMMNQTSKYLYYEDSNVQVIDLPYSIGDFRMTVMLPKPSVSIDAFISGLNDQSLLDWINKLDSAEVELSLPKFKVEYDLTMNDVLTSMGMGIAFSGGMADFSRINKNVPLFISKVIHKSYVDVNEEGTEAAAVTVVIIDRVSLPSRIIMNLNKPFVFVIRDAPSSTVLFISKIGNPS